MKNGRMTKSDILGIKHVVEENYKLHNGIFIPSSLDSPILSIQSFEDLLKIEKEMSKLLDLYESIFQQKDKRSFTKI